MTNIVEVIVDPILGNDATGQPIANASVDYFYKTLDGAIADNPVYDLLIIRVNKGDVEMREASYINIEVNKITNDSRVRIYGRIGESIIFNNVTLNINTDIILPEDNVPAPGGDPDVPVIEVLGPLFYLVNGNDFNVTDTISGPNVINRGRIIIFGPESLILIDNNDGTIDLSSRDSMVLQSGVISFVNGFSEMLTTDSFVLNSLMPTGIFQKTGSPEMTQEWRIFPLDRTAVAAKKKEISTQTPSQVIDFIWIVGGLQSLPYLAASIQSRFTGLEVPEPTRPRIFVDTAQLEISMGNPLSVSPVTIYIMGEVLIPLDLKVSSRSNSDKLKLLDNMKFIGKAKHLIKKIRGILQNEIEGQISITGNLLRNANPLFLRTIVTNTAAKINTISLENAEVYLPTDIIGTIINSKVISNQISEPDELDYNNKFMSNSYNNNGSIFRKVKLITADYVHDKFDGNVFAVDATNNDITITIPTDALEDRLFIYKRIDNSGNTVTIVTPNGIDGKSNYKLNNKCKNKKNGEYRKLGRVQLVGYNCKLWIIN